MAKGSFIKAIPQSLPKNPRVGAPGVAAPFDPSRGNEGVVHKTRVPPLNRRIYAKKAVPDDPSQYMGYGFFDVGSTR